MLTLYDDVFSPYARKGADRALRKRSGPNLVQWRSERLEWVMKKGFAGWITDEMRAGRAFFPLAVGQHGHTS